MEGALTSSAKKKLVDASKGRRGAKWTDHVTPRRRRF